MKKKIKYKSKNHRFDGGGNFLSGIPYVGFFDNLAMGAETTIDSTRKGYSDQPKVIQEGVLGAQDGSHFGRMWTVGAKTRDALNWAKDQGNVAYAATGTEDLLAQKSSIGHVALSNIDTTGTEATASIFDPLSMGLRKLFAKAGNKKTPGLSLLGLSAKERQDLINEEITKSNKRRDYAFATAANAVADSQKTNAMQNYYLSAFGGPLGGMSFLDTAGYDVAKDKAYTDLFEAQSKNSTSFTPIFNSPSTYSFKDGGGIYIKPSKRGTFTAAAKKHGKSVQEFASQVLANKENYSPAMVKKANFARNAAHWHDNGGMLMSDYFNNGVTMINEGGTHENNPHEGVQMGIAPDGKPNLVEEGEAIYNDYVFSNRLRVPKEVRQKYKLRGPKDMTFAEAFRQAQKESRERPNDPISQDGLENIAMILARTQEAIRGYEKAGRKAAEGGHLFSGIDDPYDYDNLPDDPDEIFGNPYSPGSPEWFAWDEAKELAGHVGIVAQKPSGAQQPQQSQQSSRRGWKFNPSNLRYADVLANAGAVFSDMMGLTNNPTLFDYIPPFQAVDYSPIGNYIPVTHFDTRYAANLAAQQAAATRRAIIQSTLPSRYANLLAADYNAQIANGDLLMKAALDDYDRAVKREEFNRGTNQVNSQLGLQASLANQDARLKYAQSALQQAKMNVDETNTTMAAKAANLGNLAESISNVGREEDAKAWRDMLIRAGVYGTLPEKPTDWSPEQWEDYQKYIAKYRTSSTAAKGGKIRKKKGLTY